MSGVRIYDLAKELQISNNDVLEMLKTLGEPVKAVSSSISETAAAQVRQMAAQRNGGSVAQRPAASARPAEAPRNGNSVAGGADGAKPADAASPATPIQVPDVVSLKEFADLINVPAPSIQKKLMGLGVLASLNQKLSPAVVTRLAKSYGVAVEVVAVGAAPTAAPAASPAAAPVATAAPAAPSKPAVPPVAVVAAKPRQKPAGPVVRPPVVTIMGHVDHGKTSLLDAIRNAKVAAGEFGGITQHIGAYQVDVQDPSDAAKKRKITFLDTPGHEAFTAMRARGAQVTDIAVLVVAADDGIMPQTIEAINHARAAGVPIIVAVNKIDKEGANPTRVLTQLTEHNVMPEAYGGDVQTVEVSAKEGLGLDDLLETIILVADAEVEPKADPTAPATATVIEAELDKGRGVVTTILVDQGTVKMGDSVVAGTSFGKIKAMFDDLGQRVKSAEPAKPVQILGLNTVPNAGDRLEVVKDDRVARQIASERETESRQERLTTRRSVTLEDIQRQIKDSDNKTLNVIIKGDVQGSVEAIRQSLEKIDHPEVKVRFIASGVGAVNESDVLLASASQAIIVAFNVRADNTAARLAEKEHIEIREYKVIYDLIDDVKSAMAGLLDPIYEEHALGTAEVRAIFKLPRAGGTIAGCYILDGKVVRGSNVRVRRGGKIVYTGTIDNLKREKDDAREVAQGYECGILVPGYDPVELDRLECYEMRRIERTL
jgi:translation initiation factor IF-2